ncbi:MAG TPA: sulfatase-like hydrolase/transferase [Gammaproteobacteria bacterium]
MAIGIRCKRALRYSAAALLAWAAVVSAASAQEPSDGRRPNILLIVSDDIGLDVTSNMYPGVIESLVEQYGPSGHGHPDYELIDGRPASTPTLDALARDGMSFMHAWVQPFCSPSRASLLTGLFAAKTGVLDYTNWLSQNHHSFVQDLKDEGGYSTAAFGKWHVAGLGRYPGMKPKEAGFDLYKGNLNGGIATYWDYDYHVQDDRTPPHEWRTERPPVKSLPGIAATTYAPVVKGADAIEWITEQEQENPDKPWFVWLAFNLSHITGRQQPNPMAVPNIDTLDEVSRAEMEACGGTFGSANVGSCSDKALMRAMTNALDTIVGKVLDAVDALDPNTYVIYIGDNGTWMFGERREFIDNMYITRRGRSKGTAYESGVRVPLVIRGPGIEAGSRSAEVVHGVDLFATILDLAGLDVPETVPDRHGERVALDSMSLAPILFDGAAGLRDPNEGYLLAETVNPVKGDLRQVGARNGTYKVVCSNGATPASCEFYDLLDDPLEEYPLAKPDSCAGYADGTWGPALQEWHFCRLLEVVATQSFLRPGYEMPERPAPPARRRSRPAPPAD